MPSITTWNRLEPRPRGDDLPGLAARVGDPLWLLARQWQVGEFDGEDGGSPVEVSVTARSAHLTAYALGDGGAARPYGGEPLEVLVEREPPVADLGDAVEAGLELVRRLDAAGLGAHAAAFRTDFALAAAGPLAPESAEWLALAARRAPDGAEVARAHAAGEPVPLPPDATEAAAVRDVLDAFVRWYAALHPPVTDSAWVPERMEHAFAVAARLDGTDVVLTADSYLGDQLDWYDLRADPGTALPATERVATTTVTVLPAPVTYPGMPAARWWQFEDARVNLARVESAPEDLARMLVVEFATVYGNDWHLVPLRLPYGSVTEVAKVTVRDTFGGITSVGPAAGPDWSLFRPSRAGGGRAELLVLAPVVATLLESEPVEDVRLVRDELANVGWAVESRVPDAAGRPVDRTTEEAVAAAVPPPPAADDPAVPLTYRIASEVPGHWFPLLPERDATGLRLRRGTVPRADGTRPQPRGRLLAPDPLRLYDAEVPRSGVRVTRAYAYTRGPGGETYVWVGRRKRAGRGEASSGLVHDTATP